MLYAHCTHGCIDKTKQTKKILVYKNHFLLNGIIAIIIIIINY